MRVFHCDHCGQLLFFENVNCLHCGRALAYVPETVAPPVPTARTHATTWLFAGTGRMLESMIPSPGSASWLVRSFGAPSG